MNTLMIHRNQCVLCLSNKLRDFYVLNNFPLLSSPTIQDISTDIYTNLVFNICNDCKCVQLVTLIEPSILYSFDNKSTLTSLWRQHHSEFTSFIKKTIQLQTICEVGGGSNPLFPFFNLPNLDYSVLDLYECPFKIESIKYKIGNCENFTDYTEDSIILSHTFEHLYSPHDFLKSVSVSSVKNIFISVPHFNLWLKDKLTVNLLFNQHTFYFESAQLEQLFSEYGFICKNTQHFTNHSLFYHFTKETHIPINIPPCNVEIDIYNHFNLKERNIRSFSLDKPFYIMPSFYIGQIIYYYLNNKENVMGFIDNDINKCGKRLYGTPLLTYAPSVVNETSADILLANTPYFNEMSKQLRLLNANIVIHKIELS
jgi:hypothetical protein